MVINLIFHELGAIFGYDLPIEARDIVLADVLAARADFDRTILVREEIQETVPLELLVIKAVSILKLADFGLVSQPRNLALESRDLLAQSIEFEIIHGV